MTDKFQAKSLQELVGRRVMDHTPSTDVRHPFDVDSCGIAFTLDGVTYLCFEDGNDGYRSSAGPLLSYPGMPYEMGGWQGEYVRWPVICSWLEREEGEWRGACEILDVRHADTGAVLLRVGTENTDDYYPSFVADWNPPLRSEEGAPA